MHVSGRHNLTITKLSEASYGQVSLDTLTLGAGGRFLTPTLPPDFATGRRIMVIGDSFTVGLANIGNATTCISSTADCSEGNFNCHQLPVETEDATLSWGPLTAANFTADYQIIAWSGAALARDSVDHPELPREVAQELTPSDIELFGRQVAANRSWLVGNYSAWVPQVVVIGSGGNDFRGGRPFAPLDEWVSNVIGFMNTINKEFGNPEIITVVYPAETMLQGILDATQAETYRSYMFSLHQEAQAAGMTNVHQLVLDVSSMPLGGWCGAHPTAATDASIAAQLSAFIVEELPQWPSSSHPVSAQV